MSSHPLALGKHHLLNSNQLDIYVFPLFKMYMGIFSFQKCIWVLAYMYMCVLCVSLMSLENKSGHKIPRNWSCR